MGKRGGKGRVYVEEDSSEEGGEKGEERGGRVEKRMVKEMEGVGERRSRGVCTHFSRSPPAMGLPTTQVCVCGLLPSLWHQPEEPGTVMSNLPNTKAVKVWTRPCPFIDPSLQL